MPDGRIVEGYNEQWVVVPRGWSDDKVIERHHGGAMFKAWLAEQGLTYQRPTLIRGAIPIAR